MSKRILVIRFGSLGDVLLTSAPLANLRVCFPDHRITFLTKERFRPVVRRFGTVDDLVTIPDGSGLADIYRLLSEFDQIHFTHIVDLHGNLRSFLARKLITADNTVCYPKRRLERFFLTRRHKRIPEQFPHTIDLYNAAVRALGGRAFCRRPLMCPEKGEGVNALLHELKDDRPFIVMAPGAAHDNKRWPKERFAEVAVKLHEERGVSIVWAATENERAWPELESIFPPGTFLPFVSMPVDQLASVIASAKATVANDSGIAHLSSAVGTPVVAVFGPTHPALGFAPRGMYDRVVEVDEFCRPCSRHGRTPCYREQRFCLDRVTPAVVTSEVFNILDNCTGSERALFVDRDGTVIADKHFLSDPDQIEFEDGAVEALRRARQIGFKIVIISNQSGVARGLFDAATVERINARLVELLAGRGVEVDAVYYCPHYPEGMIREYAVECHCRKPAPGMLEQAARELSVDLKESYVVGDKLDDAHLGFTSPVRGLLVRSGKGTTEEQRLSDYCINGGVERFDNLAAAVNFIEKECRHA